MCPVSEAGTVRSLTLQVILLKLRDITQLMQRGEVKETPGVTGKFGLGVQNEAGKS